MTVLKPVSLTASDVTLVAVDCAYASLAVAALVRSAHALPVARVLLLTDETHARVACDGVEVITIPSIRSRSAYSQFMLRELGHYISTDYALVVQWDGFVIDGRAWADEFWNYDYVGAKWPHLAGEFCVGNGGFSLRSKRLLDALAEFDAHLNPDENEDEAICIRYRELLETSYGILFADERVADRFSFDVGHPVGPTLGFHGVFNFWQVLTNEELAVFARTAPRAIVGGLGFGALAKNLVDLKRIDAASEFVKRRLALLPDDSAALDLNLRLELLINLPTVAVSTPSTPAIPPTSRNAPCPCGSGKRYKDCHGNLANTVAPTSVLLNTEATLADALQHHERGEVQYAVERYAHILQQEPENATALHFAGLAQYQAGQPSAALELMWRSVTLNDQEPEFFSNISAAAWTAGRYDEGLWAAQRALALDGRHTGALNNLGFNLRSLNDIDGSIAAFDQALGLAPGFNYARWNRTFSLLAKGDYERGFGDYDLRLTFPQTQPNGRIPANTPIWRGESGPGKSILLLCEQGLGDTFMFARFVPLVTARNLAVTLAVPRSQVALMQQSFSGVAVVAVGAHEGLTFDFWAALWSLPAALRTTLDNLPAPAKFLATREVDVASWQRRLAEATDRATPAEEQQPRALRIGLVWQGQFAGLDNQMAERSIPPRMMSRFVAAFRECTWVSLQHGAPPLAATNVIDWTAEVAEFTQMAALIDALDLVITIDTGAAHLAAALGAETWVLLRQAGDWRYGISGENCVWSPTMRLFRQDESRRWEPVFEHVADALRKYQADSLLSQPTR